MDKRARSTAGMPSIRFELGLPMIDIVQIATRLVACLVAAMALVAVPANATDPATGERIATRWCASCHALGRAEPKTRTEAASFAEIARIPEFNERLLAFFLLDPHPKMPDMSLTRAEAADLAAYIHSMRD
jgi:mono/diheme cytochrome c family protein